jgi:hypothetical protein
MTEPFLNEEAECARTLERHGANSPLSSCGSRFHIKH